MVIVRTPDRTAVAQRLGPAGSDLLVVLGVSWAVRFVFCVVFQDSYSNDVTHWLIVLDSLDAGRNPYETGLLNWPPLWLVLIVAIDAVADFLHVSFFAALRGFLILVESTVVVALYRILVSADVSRVAVRRALLVGIALNPVAVLLICQHGNSDVIVGLFVVLSIGSLAVHARSRDLLAWLGGSLFLGLGVLTKTVPLLLAPLLAPGARLVRSAGRALGGVLFLGPAALGMSVIFVLVPDAVIEHVVGYRSEEGRFGISGLLHIFGRRDLLSALESAWVFVFVAIIALLGRRLFRAPPLGVRPLMLLAALLLMIPPVLGPGYAPQYAYWFLPLLVGTYVLLDHEWRTLLRLAYVIASVTFVWEYAVLPHYGQFAYRFAPDSKLLAEVTDFALPGGVQTLIRLPLFLVSVLVIGEGVRRLAPFSRAGDEARPEARATERALSEPERS